jgi:hypothetical protein
VNHTWLSKLRVYDYITKLCKTQAELILNYVNPNVHRTGQGEASTGSIRSLNLVVVRPMTVQLTNCSFKVVI